MAYPSSPFHHLLASFFLVIFLLCFRSATCARTHRNITLGSSLTPLGANSSWLSPSGDFAFGFWPLDDNSTTFLLAIWFDKIPGKTTVWYANGDQPVQSGAHVDLTADGQLSLRDSSGQEVWNAGVSNSSYGVMLDTGNFVLANADGTYRWQSFDVPADTILPTQVLELGSTLQARLMDTDYSSGRFILAVQSDGNLVFYLVATPSGYQYGPYWASDTVGNGTQLVFNSTGNIYFSLKNNTLFYLTNGTMDSTEEFYQRATLDSDGVFRQYVHPKNLTQSMVWNGDWSVVGFTPSDICQTLIIQDGSGVCGFNSYCTFSVNKSVTCECPPQYSFIDPNRKYKGCKADFAPQICKADESDAEDLFELTEMTNVDWPLADYEHYNPVDEDTCRKQCLLDCFCAVAVYNGGDCWKKKLPLSNGKSGSTVQRKLLLKVPKGNNSQPQSPNPGGEKKDNKTLILVGSLLLGSSVFFNFLLISAILLATFYAQKKRAQKPKPETSKAEQGLKAFTYRELEEATDGFCEEVGSGASGVVYKGQLSDDPPTIIAVKKIDKLLPETEKEFKVECQTIGQTYHKNLVRLLGFCNEGTERILVYEFMSNGSLTGFLFGSERPAWHRRVQVALGVARGLLYLHEECSTQIIHCDIKPQNILLDDNLVAKISDFGLAKLLKRDQTQTNTGVRGTRGYVAPEWFRNVGITAKVDVYSFGVILLEIICCRKNVESEITDEERTILAYWVNDCFRVGNLDFVVEGDEEAMLDMRRVERFVMVALWCIQEEPSLRPTILKVTQMLDGAAAIPVPPDPSSYISSIQ
ncbi:G-type lectin S-receptor-like serine/threonine-protein kinase LECRK3 [Typha latifolia]|uniref:G-type lectin S-receptor-like serine/threonine-protein kinase LECRK3 n=1 Tax=Typha latifolia TaxID=4733 RepID=UPI003C2BA5EE